MIKRLIIILTILVGCVFSNVSAYSQEDDPNANGYYLFSDKSANMYLDNSHVVKSDTYAIVWTKTETSDGDCYLMQWYVTKSGQISWIYGRGHRANGSQIYMFSSPQVQNASVSSSAHFQQIYDLIW